jgi:hypothetical protein
MAEKSEKTKAIESAPVADEGRFGIPGMVKKAMTGAATIEDYIRDKLGMKPAEAPTTVKKAKGGKVSSASKRADGIAQRGKTRGRMV